MFKGLFLSLFLLSATAESVSSKNDIIATIKTKDSKRRLVITQDMLLKSIFAKLQILQKMPTQEQLQAITEQARQELVQAGALFLKNQDQVMKDPSFKSELLYSAIMLNKSRQITEAAANLPTTALEDEYKKVLEKVELPQQYQIRAATFDSEEKATRALKALQAGGDFSQILLASKKQFEGGVVTDSETKSQFINIYSPNIPNPVKAVLLAIKKTGTVDKVIETVDSKDNKTYWVIRVLKIKDGTKNDLPKFDSENKNLTRRLASIAASNQVTAKAQELAKEFDIELK